MHHESPEKSQGFVIGKKQENLKNWFHPEQGFHKGPNEQI